MPKKSSFRFSINQNGEFEIVNLEITVKNLPQEFSDYRLVQLSDLHYGPATTLAHIERGLNIVSELKPDLVVFTGDYIQNSRSGLRHALATKLNPQVFNWLGYRREVRRLATALGEALDSLRPPDGVIATWGNHDYHDGLHTIKRQFPRHIKWLKNESIEIKRNDSAILISGLDDLRLGKPNLKKVSEESASLLYRSAFNLLLSHNPDISIHQEASFLKNYDLVLSGHTHGGQICFPFIGPVVTRTKQKTHISRLSEHQETYIYVNHGLGYGCLAIRVLCPPEITLITLKKG